MSRRCADRFDFLVFGGENVRWLGVLLYAIGGALRLAPTFMLGKRFSGLVAIQPGHRLVTTGLYGMIRNPSYLGLIIYSLGWAIAFRSWLGIVLVALTADPAARAHEFRGAAARGDFWRGIRSLSRAHVEAGAGGVLMVETKRLEPARYAAKGEAPHCRHGRACPGHPRRRSKRQCQEAGSTS